MDETKNLEFEAACNPLIKWLAENCHPHTNVIVTATSAELFEGVAIHKTFDFLKDQSVFIFAIDPGSEHSGVVLYDSDEHKVLWSADIKNLVLLQNIREWRVWRGVVGNHILAIEGLENQGHFVGKSTFETAEWIGRFREAWESGTGQSSFRMSRRDVKICLCGGSTYTDPDSGARRTVNDTAVANAVRGRFPETGGGSRPVVGTKSKPGPLYGMKGGHQYSALAIALTWVEMHGNKEKGNQNETE